MFKLTIDKECGCYKKDSLNLPREYETQEACELDGLRVTNHQNTNYCKKHRFSLHPSEGGYEIQMEYSCPPKEPAQ